MNVPLYSREPGDRRGAVFLSMDASRLAFAAAARADPVGLHLVSPQFPSRN
ncbi:hypothetical protein [Arthrobacter sp. D1-17]